MFMQINDKYKRNEMLINISVLYNECLCKLMINIKEMKC